MNGGLVDVGKGTLVKPKDRLFHRRQMPDNALRVSVASVKVGYEGFPRPIQAMDRMTRPPRSLANAKLADPVAEKSSSC